MKLSTSLRGANRDEAIQLSFLVMPVHTASSVPLKRHKPRALGAEFDIPIATQELRWV